MIVQSLNLFILVLAVGAKFVIANSTAECNKADVNGGSKFNVRVVECRMAAKVGRKLKISFGHWVNFFHKIGVGEIDENRGLEEHFQVGRFASSCTKVIVGDDERRQRDSS